MFDQTNTRKVREAFLDAECTFQPDLTRARKSNRKSGRGKGKGKGEGQDGGGGEGEEEEEEGGQARLDSMYNRGKQKQASRQTAVRCAPLYNGRLGERARLTGC